MLDNFSLPSGLPSMKAAQAAVLSSEAARCKPHPHYRYRRGATSAEWNNSAFEQLEGTIAPRGLQLRAHVLPNSVVVGPRMQIVSNGHLISETMYLAKRKRQIIAGLPERRITQCPGDIPRILVGNRSPRNYYHWTTQALPALLQSMKLLEEAGIKEFEIITPLLRPWQRRSLELLGLGDCIRHEIDRNATVYIGDVVYSSIQGPEAMYVPVEFREQVARRLKAALGLGTASPTLRLFISRRDSGKRPMVNEEELQRRLEAEGFVTVVLKKLGLDEQIRIFHQAAFAVAQHGAGCANFLYCQPGAQVFELLLAGMPNAGPAGASQSAGVTYWSDFFDDGGAGKITPGWRVDVDAVMTTLKLASGNGSDAQHKPRMESGS